MIASVVVGVVLMGAVSVSDYIIEKRSYKIFFRQLEELLKEKDSSR